MLLFLSVVLFIKSGFEHLFACELEAQTCPWTSQDHVLGKTPIVAKHTSLQASLLGRFS